MLFPEWSPRDGVTGNWNSQYDAISVRNATHVWIDHNRFADVRIPMKHSPSFFGHKLQVHDGSTTSSTSRTSSGGRGTSSPRTTRPCSS